MEINDKSLMGLKNKQPAGEPEKKFNSLLKQQINIFFINYFGYLTLALAIIIFTVGLFIFAYPKYQEVSKSNETALHNLQIDYNAKINYLNALRDLKNSYQQIGEADIKKIEEMVPSGDQVINLIPEIESIILRNGVVLNSIAINAGDLKHQSGVKTEPAEKPDSSAGIFGQTPNSVGQVKIDINLSSINYPVLKNLLKTFESNLRLMDVAKVNYSVQESRAILTIYSYYLAN